MKMIMLPLSLMFITKKLSTFIIILMIMSLLLLMYPPTLITSNNLMYMDMLSYIMIMLSLMSVILIMISSSYMKKISSMILPILSILLIMFMSYNMINFYIFFELVLIPTMVLIMMSGKQPERLQASMYLMMYTIMASLPLLTSIIFIKNNYSFLLSYMTLLNFNIPMLLMLAFLAKSPMYFMHLWLPKAHVEAPLEGSMILAAILLKLGGYGLIRFLPICIKSFNNLNYWIISISLIGASATGLNCIRQKDLKSLIAYSSVAHMGLVLCGIMVLNKMGLNGAIIMMIAHGLSSSALFLLVNDLYMKYHTRNTLMFKGLITMIPNITFWWFMFMAINISAPPSINTISEIMLMSSLIKWSIISMMMIFMMSLTAASFSMMMFINISHNKNMMLPSHQTQPKIYLSLFLHLIPLIILLTKMEIMTL